MPHSDISNARRIAHKAGNLTENLPYQGLVDGVVFTLDNKLSFGVTLHPISAARATPDVRLSVRNRIVSAIQGTLPPGAVIRHYTDTRPSTRTSLDQHRPPERGGSAIEQLLTANHNVLENMRRAGYVSDTSSYLTVTLNIPGRRKSTAWKGISHMPLVENARRLRSALSRQLTVAGLQASPMTQDEAWERIMDFFNPSMASSEKPPYQSNFNSADLGAVTLLRRLKNKPSATLPSVPSMRAQVACSDIDLDFDTCFMLGHTRVGLVSFLNPTTGSTPDMTEGILRALAGTHSTFMVEYQVVDTPRVRAQINDALERQETAASDPSMKAGREVYSRISTGTELVQQLEQGRVYTTMSMHAVIYARTQEELDDRRERTLAAFSAVGGCMPRLATSSTAIQLFLQNAPFSGQRSDYQVPAYYHNAADCMPKTGHWKGSRRGVLSFRSRNGNVFSINPLDMRNAGVVVGGSSGNGKSVLISMLAAGLVHHLNTGLTVIDPKKDYVPLFIALGAANSIVSIDTDARLPNGVPVVINPMDLPEGISQPDEDKQAFLEQFLIALGVHCQTGMHQSIVKQAIENFYLRFSLPVMQGGQQVMAYNGRGTLTDFADVIGRLNTVGDQAVLETPHLLREVKDMANALRAFCGNTPLGRLLDGQTTIDIRSRYLCLDISGMMNGTERLRNVGMLLTQSLVWQRNIEMKGAKVVVIEEGGVTKELPGLVSMVNRMFMTLRSLGGIPILVVQNLEDAQAYRGVLNNAATRILLASNPSERVFVAQAFELNEAMQALYASLGGEKGRYSEALVLQDGAQGSLDGDVGQLWLSKEAYWMTTSTKSEADYRKHVAEELFSGDQALAALYIAQEARNAA